MRTPPILRVARRDRGPDDEEEELEESGMAAGWLVGG